MYTEITTHVVQCIRAHTYIFTRLSHSTFAYTAKQRRGGSETNDCLMECAGAIVSRDAGQDRTD